MRYFTFIFLLLTPSLLTPSVLLAQHASHAKKTIVVPPAGTMFVNTYYATDSSGAIAPKDKANPNMPDDTLYIVKSGVTMFGRSRCIEIVAKSHPDTLLFSYAENGDLYIRSLNHDSEWSPMQFSLPVGKKIVQKLQADSGTLLGRDYYAPHNRTIEVVGHDTASVGHKVYNCIELLVTDIRFWNNRNWLQGTRWWFSPELGYIVKQNMGWSGAYFLNQQLKIWQPPSK